MSDLQEALNNLAGEDYMQYPDPQLIVEAAERVVGGWEVQWCLEHDSSARNETDDVCWKWTASGCNMKPLLLIKPPDNTERTGRLK